MHHMVHKYSWVHMHHLVYNWTRILSLPINCSSLALPILTSGICSRRRGAYICVYLCIVVHIYRFHHCFRLCDICQQQGESPPIISPFLLCMIWMMHNCTYLGTILSLDIGLHWCLISVNNSTNPVDFQWCDQLNFLMHLVGVDVNTRRFYAESVD